MSDSRRLFRLETLTAADGLTYIARLAVALASGDDMDDHRRSDLILLEDDAVLGPPHAAHRDIQIHGEGRYSHWGDHLYFSTSDGTDPRTNGRRYSVLGSTAERPQTIRDRAISVLQGLPDEPDHSEAYLAAERVLSALRPEASFGEDEKLFWTDQAFKDAMQRLCGPNQRSAERKYTVLQLIQSLAHIDGEMVECGVYNGATAWFMALGARRSGRARRLHLFDSFDGLSEPGPADGDFWRRGSLRISEAEARSNLAEFLDVYLYRGWIPDRFDEVTQRSFAFVHVDVDLYEPTLDSIEFFYPRLAPGGILLCDDYGFLTCPGATRAMDEAMSGKPEKVIHLPTGQGMIIKQ